MNYPNITYKRTCTICNKGKEYPEISYSPSFLREKVAPDAEARREQMRKDLMAQEDTIRREISGEIRSYQPMGKMSEIGEVLGIKPTKGVPVSTPFGTYVFAKARLPDTETIRRWGERYKEAEELGRRAATEFTFMVVGPGLTTGNIRELEQGRRLKAKGLLSPRELKYVDALEEFWAKYPDADYGVVQPDGSIKPSTRFKKVTPLTPEVTEAVWNTLPAYKQAEIAKSVGLRPRTGTVYWKELTPSERNTLSKATIPKAESNPTTYPEVSYSLLKEKPIARVVIVPGGSQWICQECGKVLISGSQAVKMGAKTFCIECVRQGKPSLLVETGEVDIDLLAITEGNPLRKFCCRQCGECAPTELLEEGKFPERIAWLRHHYKEKHPSTWGKKYPEVKYKPSYLKETDEEKLLRQIDYWQKYQNKIQNRNVEDFTIAIREMGMVGLWARYNIPKYPAYKTIGNYNVTYEPPIGDVIEHLLVSQVNPKEADYDIPLATQLSAELKKEFEKPSYLKEGFIKVGDRVRYIGISRYRDETWPKEAWIEKGIVGTVSEYHPRLPAFRSRDGEIIEAIEAWATVKWDNGAITAIDPDTVGKTWERVTRSASYLKEALPETECQLISPQYYDVLTWLNVPVPDYSFAIEPEVKERKIDEVLQKLKDGVANIHNSAIFREFLTTMAKFWDYSIGNQILIMIQRPTATRVAGFMTWKDLGRYVKAGEKGIAILAPCLPPRAIHWAVRTATGLATVRQWPDGKWRLTPPYPETERQEFKTKQEALEALAKYGYVEEISPEEITPTYFKVVYVFDISQTEGKPLPEFEVPVLTGAYSEVLYSKLMQLAVKQSITVSFEPRPKLDPAIKGTLLAKSIWVKPDEPEAQRLKTLGHEMAHYYTEHVYFIPRADAEVIAESVAFTVCAHFGFDTGTRSFPYVALWAKEKKVLEQNLANIRKISGRIIEELGG